jgi:hypothetical protein
MATYPVVLYPKRIASFRQLAQHPKEAGGQGRGRGAGGGGAEGGFQLGLDTPPVRSTAEGKEAFPLLPAPFPPASFGQGIKAEDKREGLHGLQTHSRRYSRTSQVFALRVLGSGLLVIGLLSMGKPVGILTLLLAGASFGVTFFLNRTFHKSPLPPESKRLAEPVQQTPSDELQTYLRALSTHMMGQVLQPDGVTDAPIGASEKAFGQVLEKFFPGRVKAQLRLPIPNWDGAYSTDFTISFPEIGIWIDVEIDEPYDYKTGKPTHCSDDERDRNRNSFFLLNNWIVVRFSEEQVVRYPESCCKEIALVIRRVTGIEKYVHDLADATSLAISPMWTSRQAKKMAKAKVRDKYLRVGSRE